MVQGHAGLVDWHTMLWYRVTIKLGVAVSLIDYLAMYYTEYNISIRTTH